MSKQELIEKLKEEKEKNHVRCVVANPATIEANNTFYQVDEALETAINYAEQLDEPQKVKVPQFVAEWYEEKKEDLEFYIYQFCVDYAGSYQKRKGSEFYLWFDKSENKPIETLIRMQEGYEVEEEPKWKIINDQKYCLTSIEAGYGNSLHWAFDSTKKKPILFDNEETALYTAYITGGTVEKV